MTLTLKFAELTDGHVRKDGEIYGMVHIKKKQYDYISPRFFENDNTVYINYKSSVINVRSLDNSRAEKHTPDNLSEGESVTTKNSLLCSYGSDESDDEVKQPSITYAYVSVETDDSFEKESRKYKRDADEALINNPPNIQPENNEKDKIDDEKSDENDRNVSLTYNPKLRVIKKEEKRIAENILQFQQDNNDGMMDANKKQHSLENTEIEKSQINILPKIEEFDANVDGTEENSPEKRKRKRSQVTPHYLQGVAQPRRKSSVSIDDEETSAQHRKVSLGNISRRKSSTSIELPSNDDDESASVGEGTSQIADNSISTAESNSTENTETNKNQINIFPKVEELNADEEEPQLLMTTFRKEDVDVEKDDEKEKENEEVAKEEETLERNDTIMRLANDLGISYGPTPAPPSRGSLDYLADELGIDL